MLERRLHAFREQGADRSPSYPTSYSAEAAANQRTLRVQLGGEEYAAAPAVPSEVLFITIREAQSPAKTGG